MIHVGDITKLNGAELPVVDVVTGGSPCQDLSIAGARAGLAGERSGLFMEQIRLVKEMRDADRRTGRTGWNVRPRYMVWENVPGAFSSNNGKDFQAVLTEIVRIVEPDAPDVPLPEKGRWSKAGAVMGYGADGSPFSICYRVHDAQFWGVPQRRKRIALVADFGGLSACSILFEPESMRGDTPQGGEERKGSSFGAGTGSSSAIGFNRERCGAVTMQDGMPTLQAAAGESGNNKPMVAISFQERAGKPGGGKGILIQDEHVGALSTLNNQSVLSFNSKQLGLDTSVDVAATLGASDYKEPQAVFPLEGNGSRPSHRGDGYGAENDPSFTLNAVEHHGVAYGFDPGASRDVGDLFLPEASKTLSNGTCPGFHNGVVAFGFKPNQGVKARSLGYEEEMAPTLNTSADAGILCLNDQGGNRMDVTEDQTSTLRANMNGHQPIVYGISAYDSNAMKSSNPHSGVYVAETARTLDLNGGSPACNQGGMAVLAIENHPADSRVDISKDGIVQTLSGRMGTGGGNVPMVMERKDDSSV